jgi:hypothetical protein
VVFSPSLRMRPEGISQTSLDTYFISTEDGILFSSNLVVACSIANFDGGWFSSLL